MRGPRIADGRRLPLARSAGLVRALLVSGIALLSSATVVKGAATGGENGTPPRVAQGAAQPKSDGGNAGLEVLSDTRGVDFGPYFKRILRKIYKTWIPLIPQEAQPPRSAKGETVIRFAIGKDGTLKAMHLDGSTHDDAINRAAWGAITGVKKFEPLPEAFTGEEMELRVHFTVNMPPPAGK